MMMKECIEIRKKEFGIIFKIISILFKYNLCRDRKRKKYVNSDDPKAKKIRTEEGTWVPASYKSGRYENWQKQQKSGYQNENDEDDNENGQKKDFRRYGKNKFINKNGKKIFKSIFCVIKKALFNIFVLIQKNLNF